MMYHLCLARDFFHIVMLASIIWKFLVLNLDILKLL